MTDKLINLPSFFMANDSFISWHCLNGSIWGAKWMFLIDEQMTEIAIIDKDE